MKSDTSSILKGLVFCLGKVAKILIFKPSPNRFSVGTGGKDIIFVL